MEEELIVTKVEDTPLSKGETLTGLYNTMKEDNKKFHKQRYARLMNCVIGLALCLVGSLIQGFTKDNVLIALPAIASVIGSIIACSGTSIDTRKLEKLENKKEESEKIFENALNTYIEENEKQKILTK